MKKNTFVINEKKIEAKPFDFELVVDLEDMGANFEDLQNKPFGFIASYLSLCMGVERKVAIAEINAHLSNGGTFEDIMSVLSKEIENSGFFQNSKTN